MRASVAGLAMAVLAVSSAHAQYMISAHSGVVQHVEGTAYLNDQQIEPRAGEFPNIKENQVFRTSEGMAEVLLTPGVFLRMGENSSIKMVSNKLTDTRVEVLSGSAMVECDIAKDNAITLLAKGNEMSLVKHGLYRVDADQGLFKVYDGEALVKNDSGQVTLHKGKQTLLTGALMAENFDPKADDDLYRWSDRRSGYLAKANVSSANTIVSGGSGYGGSGYAGLGAGLGYPGLGYAGLGYAGLGSGGLGYGGLGYGGFPGDCLGGSLGFGAYSPWQFNPMFGMYTYVPCGGAFYSPFGYGFYSPYTVYQAPVYYGGGGGGGTTKGTGISRTGTGTGKHEAFLSSRSSAVASRGSSSTGGYSGGLARGGSALSTSSSSVSVSSAGHSGGGSSGGHGR
jgi:hypothetical protein